MRKIIWRQEINGANVNWQEGKDEIMLYDCPVKITSLIIIKGHSQGRLLNVDAFIVSPLQGDEASRGTCGLSESQPAEHF